MRGLVSALTAAALLGAAPAQALVGPSTEAGAREAAQVVMVLKRAARGAGFCSGVVLSPTVVLTAGHCAQGAQALAINTAPAGAPPQLIAVRDVAMHPEFRANAAQRRERSIDMALLRLTTPLPARYTPARLDEAGAVAAGARFRIVGFGLTREGDERSAGRLRAGELEARAPLSRILLWARDPQGAGFGACTGDSGGPVFSDSGAVAAVVSWSAGAGARRCGELTQAALVAPQRDWIARVSAGWR